MAKSGTDALRFVLSSVAQNTARSTIAMSAYTCPDLYTAVHAAGFKAALFDIDPVTLLPRPASIPPSVREQLAAVILSNLYGLIDPMTDWNLSSDVVLIDDGCQAALGEVDGKMVGSRGVGVISFGRGKAFSGVGGGAAFGVPSGHPVEASSFGGADLLRGALMWMLEKPRLYGIPASLPFLKLGETPVHLEVPRGVPSRVQRRYAHFQLLHRSEIAAVHRERMRWWREALSDLKGVVVPELARGTTTGESPVLLRYPILVEEGARGKLLSQLGRYGVSKSYPTTINGYTEIGSKVQFGDISGAVSVAQRVLTLPLHRYVTRSDVARVVQEIKQL